LLFKEDYSLFNEIPSLSSSSTMHTSDDQWTALSEEITFSGKRKDCCICFIDMVNSTKITSQLTQQQIGKYYSIFLNSTAIIAKNFGATIVKNAGDCLIYYFHTSGSSAADDDDNNNNNNKHLVFKDVIECGMTIIAAHSIINTKLYEEKLPSLNYRISAEYGTVEFAKSVSSQTQDLFGHTMNLCAKINPLASPNGMVIGNTLYQIVKSFNEYNFEERGKFSNTPSKNTDTDIIYAISSKQKNNILNPFSRTPERKLLQKPSYSSIDNLNIENSKYSKTTQTKKIMVVDDNEDVLFTFRLILQSEGYKVDNFINPIKALEQFEKDDSYDMIITDIKMPNLSGLDLYNKIKSKKKDAKVLFISALDVAEMILSILPDLTEKNLLKKPIEKEKLVNTIKLLIDDGIR
jgi:two-component system, OmpR family, response regulator ChvI